MLYLGFKHFTHSFYYSSKFIQQIYCILFALQRNKIIGTKIREINMSINEILIYFNSYPYVESGHALFYFRALFMNIY